MKFKNECPKVASYMQTNCDDLPHLNNAFGNTLSESLDKLYQSALYGFLLQSPTDEDYQKVTLLHYDCIDGFEEKIMYGQSEVGTIKFKHVSIDGSTPAHLSYEAFTPEPEQTDL